MNKLLTLILLGAALFLANPSESLAQLHVDSVMVYGITRTPAPNQALAKQAWFYHDNDSTQISLVTTRSSQDNGLRYGAWKKKLIDGTIGPIPVDNLKDLVFVNGLSDDTTKVYILWKE